MRHPRRDQFVVPVFGLPVTVPYSFVEFSGLVTGQPPL
jgi:hypothetical protein